MAKMTSKDKADKTAAKKAAEKAKKDAKRAARLEKKRKQAEAKKAKKLAKLEKEKAKKLAKLEKEKAKKLALKEKKRLAKEKQKAEAENKKNSRALNAKPAVGAASVAKAEIDIKEAAKSIKAALSQIAAQMALLPKDKRIKKAKSIYWMGYDVETVDGGVIVRFYPEKFKKSKLDAIASQPKKNDGIVEKPSTVDEVVEPADGTADELMADQTRQSVEIVPAGDLYGQDGQTSNYGEVANLDSDDEDDGIDDADDKIDNDDDDNDDNETISDSRDEQNVDLINHRAEFFNQYGDDFEPNDD